jgi:pimeloyl-ACP methyl ester carboxylesterase
MKSLFYSFVVVLVVLVTLLTISQLSTAQNKSEANTESENQKRLQKTNLTQTNLTNNIWTQIAVNSVGQGALSNSATPTAPLLALFSQQGPKLVGTGAVGNAYQGISVSLSGDGNTAIVGGSSDNSLKGAAWVWTRSGGIWTQQGTKLVGSGSVGNAQQGRSVSISADGNTAIVGGGNDNSNIGAAWVWTRSGGVWTQQGSKLVGSGAVGFALQGISVSLSADGSTAIVGAIDGAWVWTRSAGIWTQQGPKLVGSGSVGQLGSSQRTSVSLSADGNTAIVGWDGDNNSVGAAWVWTRSGSVWTQQGLKLVGSGAVGSARQGHSVSLSADGNTAIVGGPTDNNFTTGAAWVWTRNGGIWTQQGVKLVGTGAGVAAPLQGASVSLSADGNTAIVGRRTSIDQDTYGWGAAWVWTRSGGVWTQLGTKLVGSDIGGGYDAFGISVSLAGDGNTAIIGGRDNTVGTGAAWVFINPNPAPTSVVFSITPSVPVSGPSDQDIFVSGTNFQQGLTVDISAPGGGVTTLSGEQIQNVTDTSFIMRATVNAPGSWSIKVKNPDNQQSAVFPFTVASGGPTPFISSINPVAPTSNGADQYVIVTGGNFQNGLKVNASFPSGGIATLQGTGQIQNVTANSFRLRITLNADGAWKIRVINPNNSQSAQFTFNVLPSGPPPTGLPTSALSPVIGPLRVTTSNLAIADGKWQFNQHKTGSHTATGGISSSNDTFAWDADLFTPTSGNADAGKAVFATAAGQVVSYVGTQPGAGPGAVLIAHPNAASPVWFSGYTHMTNVRVTLNHFVDSTTLIGEVGRAPAPNDHLHFVVYSGTNTRGNLRSFNTVINERSSNTPPTISLITPSTVIQGDQLQSITINGANFAADSILEVETPNGQSFTVDSSNITSITATTIIANVRFVFPNTYKFTVINSARARSSAICPQSCVNVTPTALRTPVILIPGVMGSRLGSKILGNWYVEIFPSYPYDNNHLFLKTGIGNENPIGERPIAATDIFRDYAYGSLGNFYSTMIDVFTGPIGGYKLYNVTNPAQRTSDGCDQNQVDADFFLFPYDWRNSNAQSARDLKGLVDCIKKIRDPGNSNPNFKVNIIAHSMGGLIARRYILDGSQNYDPRVKTVVTLGTPWLGAPTFMNVLMSGEHESLNKLMSQSLVRDIARYMPGPHELIPSRAYANELRGIYAGDFPFGENFDLDERNGIEHRYSFESIKLLMNRYRPPNTVIDPGSNTENFHDRMYSGSRLQDNWSNDQTGIAYYNFVGRCETGGTVGTYIAENEWYKNGLGIWTQKIYLNKVRTEGDCTVPEISGLRQSSNGNYLGPAVPKVFDRVSHGGLPNDSRIIVAIDCLFLDRAPSTCLNQSRGALTPEQANQIPATAVYNVDILGSTMVSISDSFGNTVSPLSTSVSDNVPTITTNITGDDFLNAAFPLDQNYKVVLTTSTSPLVITITKNEGENITLAIRYLDLSIPPDVLAELDITPQGIGALKYDSDGNGTFDTQVNPTISVTGTQAQDIEAPHLNINETVQVGNSRIDLEATDAGTGVQTIMYSLNGTTFQQYSTPLTLNAATTPTIYAFADDNVFNRSGLVTHNLTASNIGFTVGGPGAASTGQAINASFNAPSGRPTDDWIGLFTVGSLNSAFVAKVYTNGLTSGNLQFTAPSQPGTYEFRYLLNDGFSSVAVSSMFNVTTTNRTLFDYDGDGRADLSVRRPSDNIWYILRGTAGYFNIEFGVTGDLIAPADYDGDGKTDVCVFRPSNGTWYTFNSQSQSFTTAGWGANGDLPVPADHDGDGKADLVVFRPSTGQWFTRFANGTFSTVGFGVAGDKPVVGDFDGDGKTDIALFRPSDGNWYILKTGFGFFVQTWGVPGDIPVPADYDGDGKTDVAVFRPSTGQWFRIQSTAGFDTVGWGVAGDRPIPADYDGDGKSDVAVFRPSNATWYIVGSTSGQLIQNYGVAGDLPTQGAFIY